MNVYQHWKGGSSLTPFIWFMLFFFVSIWIAWTKETISLSVCSLFTFLFKPNGLFCFYFQAFFGCVSVAILVLWFFAFKRYQIFLSSLKRCKKQKKIYRKKPECNRACHFRHLWEAKHAVCLSFSLVQRLLCCSWHDKSSSPRSFNRFSSTTSKVPASISYLTRIAFPKPTKWKPIHSQKFKTNERNAAIVSKQQNSRSQ